MTTDTATLNEVKSVLVTTLGIEDRAASIDASTELFGGIPELDSLAVLELVTAIEDKFGITIEDEEFGGEIFETLGSLDRVRRVQAGLKQLRPLRYQPSEPVVSAFGSVPQFEGSRSSMRCLGRCARARPGRISTHTQENAQQLDPGCG